jgi:hypothetical protein
MYSRIEIERAKIEAEKLNRIDSRIIYGALFFWGFIGLPFFFVKENKKGLIYIMLSLITFVLFPLFAPGMLIGLSILAYSIFYIYDYIKTFKQLGLKQKEIEIKRFQHTKGIIEEKNKTDEELVSDFDTRIEVAILNFEIKNKMKDSRVAGILWWFGAFIGLSSFYVKDTKNGIIFIALWILSILSNIIIGESDNLAVTIAVISFSLLYFIFYFHQGFVLNDKVEQHNNKIRAEKLLMLRDLEKELIEKEIYKKNTEIIENI